MNATLPPVSQRSAERGHDCSVTYPANFFAVRTAGLLPVLAHAASPQRCGPARPACAARNRSAAIAGDEGGQAQAPCPPAGRGVALCEKATASSRRRGGPIQRRRRSEMVTSPRGAISKHNNQPGSWSMQRQAATPVGLSRRIRDLDLERVTESLASGEKTVGNRYYICSRTPAKLAPATALVISRAHWRCEEETHWTADAILQEDKRRLAWLRHPTVVFVASVLGMMGLNILAVARKLSRLGQRSTDVAPGRRALLLEPMRQHLADRELRRAVCVMARPGVARPSTFLRVTRPSAGYRIRAPIAPVSGCVSAPGRHFAHCRPVRDRSC